MLEFWDLSCIRIWDLRFVPEFLEFHLYLREYKMRILGDKRSL